MRQGARNVKLVVIRRQVRVRACLPLAPRKTALMSAKLVLAVGTQKLDRSSLHSMCASHVQLANSHRMLRVPRQLQILMIARVAWQGATQNRARLRLWREHCITHRIRMMRGMSASHAHQGDTRTRVMHNSAAACASHAERASIPMLAWHSLARRPAKTAQRAPIPMQAKVRPRVASARTVPMADTLT